MNGGQLPTNQLVHDINWGAFDHASRVLQLMSCSIAHTHNTTVYTVYYLC